ncbi:MAG: hypothetical protein QOG63_1001 [Thermoleophilaceae bacterium]|jgi:AcrR family transcriptional regulator|nr:hypothetical protein [Thermoleophilaceae bacterium]
MTARADAAEATATRILDAVEEVFWERPSDQISLEEVARRAGVAKQTVLRRFGSKGALLDAAARRAMQRADDERGHVEPGDGAGAIRVLVTHYERIGDAVLRMLAQEALDPRLKALADPGRAYHAAWCERVFAPSLDRLRGPARDRRLAELIAVTDVYVWKLLRRDRGLSRRATEAALRELVEALTGGTE